MRDMAQTAQGPAQVARDRADIAALAADHLQAGGVGLGLQQGQAVDPQRARGQFHLDPLAGQVIGALALDHDGGKGGRDLHDVTGKAPQRRLDLRRGGAVVAGADHAAGRVVGGRLGPPVHHEVIAFQRVGDDRHGLGGLAQGDGQDAGRVGVQRAGMTGLLGVQRPTHLGHDGGRIDARGLVHDQPAVDVPALLARHDHS